MTGLQQSRRYRAMAVHRVHAVAHATGMIPSTCLHILRELVVEGLVGFDEITKRYSLAPGILTLADKMLRRTPLAPFIGPQRITLDDVEIDSERNRAD